jgi:protocatechuate 3,4-dioxygenase beta subunit
MIDGVTDAQGLLRFERMKTGPYQVSLDGATATASVELEADRTAKVTLVD